MLKQIETNKSERQTLVAYQKNCYEQLQVLHKNIEDLEKTNEILKEHLENEKQTVNALQTERVRHLEERTILTAIYERLKSEISKVDQLEGAVTTMNKKASKLALIAEYNKQLGEKLQNEVAEKDVAINELQNNVKQLNSFQMESTKEKVALCEELNKVFSVKEVLNTKLTAELEKNVILDESKREIQNSANLQLKEIQAAYNREHEALKTLVQDVKKLVAERDSLLQTNKDFESKCINLMMEHDKLVEYIKTLQTDFKEKEEKFYELEKHIEKQSDVLETLQKSSLSEVNYLRNKCELTTNQVDSLKTENEALKGSLEYLQTDIGKIRNDLDQSKQNEQEYKNALENLQNTYNELYQEYRNKTNALQQIIEENEALKINVYSLGEKFKCLSEENERISQDSLRLETMLAEKYQTTKVAGLPTPKHVENVLDDINARDEEILILQDRLREHEERGEELNDLFATISENRNNFEKKNELLQQELDSTVQDLQNYRERCDKLEKIIEELEKNMVSIDVLEDQHERFNSTLEARKQEYKIAFQKLEEKINDLQEQKEQDDKKYEETAKNCEQYKEAHEKLQKAHKVLALKLFTAVRVLICEKVAMETSQTKLNTLEKDKERLLKHNEQSEEELHQLRMQLNEFQQELDEAKCENSSLFEDITSTRALISDLQLKLSEASIGNNQKIKEQEKCIVTMKNQLDESRKSLDNLQIIIADLEATTASLEFEKSSAEIRLHELETQTQSEIIRSNEMKRAMQSTLSLIIEMKERGNISPHVHNQLLQSFSVAHV
ncbi:myosin-J heavy chain-like [Atheta coriaria]|uniref:myosin-J heavy chain-like n=1 Tax=Dalotia coriaria TaxID=877792 RepID=UPI0031F3F6EA